MKDDDFGGRELEVAHGLADRLPDSFMYVAGFWRMVRTSPELPFGNLAVKALAEGREMMAPRNRRSAAMKPKLCRWPA